MAKQKSNVFVHVLGVASLLGVGAVCGVGTHSAITLAQQNADQSITQTQSQIQRAKTKAAMKAEHQQYDQTETTSDDGYVIPADKDDAQKAWAEENHVHWDENGNPVDENGLVVDDPATEENEIDVAKANGTLSEDGHSKSKDDSDESKSADSDSSDKKKKKSDKKEKDDEEVIESRISYDEYAENKYMDAWYHHDYIDKSGDHYYYIVTEGLTLKDISEDIGYTVDELAEFNNVKNPKDLSGFSRIYLPDYAPFTNHNLSGAGRG